MIKEAIFHEPESNYSFPISNNSVILRLRVSKKDIFDEINVIYGMKYDFFSKQKSASMTLKYVDDLFAYYEVKLVLEDVRLVYIFELHNKKNKYYYSEDGITDTYDFNLAYFNCFQIAYINDADIHKTITWAKNAVMYEIFVDRFYQGNHDKKTNYINLKWNDIPSSNSFAGGDLQGITQKLSYLKDLGINVLYLTPIFQSISNHKYDINNYFEIDQQFGSKEDFKELVNRAHLLGIKIILDGVFNHTSDLLQEFQDVIKHGKNSRYYDWFIIDGDTVDLEKVNYETFSNCYYHPKFNTSNLEVREYLIKIAKHYIEEYDIDGWRLDVSDEVSHNFWRHFREEIKKTKQDIFIFGENWHDAKTFLQGDQFDSIMNYAVTKNLYDYIAYGKKDAQAAAEKFNNLLIKNTTQVNQMMVNLLDSHDTNRFFTEAKNNQDKLLQGLAVIFSYVGIPCLYYGIEIPLEGGYDPDNRRCFNWEKVREDNDYQKTLKAIIKLKKLPAFQTGEINIAVEDEMLVITRSNLNESFKVYINTTKEAKKINAEKILVANKFAKGMLSSDGFVVMEG